ncbi:Metallo-dependent phosphatase-like protein [Pilobolus umbonatus]|nr:Metallo-dependent phosphatase-like protein [Pilobolus umbonatus]
MRLNIPIAVTVLCSLVSAYNQQQEVLNDPEISLQNELNYYSDEIFHVDSITKSCSSCISLLHVLKRMSFLSESLLTNSLIKVCKRTKRVDIEVCEGVIREHVPIIRKVIPTMAIAGRDGHLACAAILNSCPYPEVNQWNITFPKPKPLYLPTPARSVGQTLSVLQLSDWHIDTEYESGTEVYCDKPFCCRSAYTDYNNITKEANKWGEYTCDTSLPLIESLLDYIPTVEPNIEFGILTGDIPPHEVWSTLPFVKTESIQNYTYSLLHDHFDSPSLLNSPLYPAVGNHESAPTNIFPLLSSNIPTDNEDDHAYDLKWLYRSLAESWKGWLSHKENPVVESNTGSYTVRPLKGLKLISLNTNFCYTLNWWLYEQPMQKDPNGILSWLIDELQDSEDKNEKVWIIGHIAPGDDTCFHDYSNYYYQIVDRYNHVIASQFFGHTHQDELTLFYKNDMRQTADNAISVGYIAPSITPFLNVNPGFRVYKIDTVTFEVVDSITYIANLDQADTWEYGPNWHKEYSAREAYQSTHAPLLPNEPLTAAWWHKVTEDMEQNVSTFNKYNRYRTKSAPMHELCVDECKSTTICNIRAGKSELRCDYEPDVLPGGDASIRKKKSRAPAFEHKCALNLIGVNHLH